MDGAPLESKRKSADGGGEESMDGDCTGKDWSTFPITILCHAVLRLAFHNANSPA
jgi:hypothetical protein